MVDELAEARVIQTRLYPDHAPDIPHFRLSGFSMPCLAVGGDWYDYISLPAGRIGIVLGDVAGKGTGAALLMTSTRSILRMYAERVDPPGAVLTEVNRVLKDDLPNAKFVTMIYAVLDPDLGKLTFSNAGHHPPLLVNSAGARILKTRSTLPLGVARIDYPEHEIELAPGDRLFLYSDGVVEARSPVGEEYSETRLLQHAGTPTATPKSLLQDIQAHMEGHPANDDVTVVMLEAL